VPELSDLLRRTAERIADYRDSVGDRPVAPPANPARLREALGGPLPAEGAGPEEVIEQLATAAEPALVATAGPRYFGFVVGGALPAATCADLLTTGWDQVAFNSTTSPVAAAVEEVAGEWLREAFGLPADSSFGLVTGGQGANTVGLAAARHRVLARAGRCACSASGRRRSSRSPPDPRGQPTPMRWLRRWRLIRSRPRSSAFRPAT
jgi:glutamate/tyrosine decarboxylase-like PLP-dependent enzyme